MTKVLLVEDDISIATIYRIKLDHVGLECRHAIHGLEALHLLKEFTPDIILLDLKMPVMDGETFLQRLRKLPEFSATPVIILTNLNKTEAPKTLWHLGISAYVVKAHTTPTEIVTTIKETVA
jgi:DNA-binding response OmpR family regulator